jgi:hypothetical protein
MEGIMISFSLYLYIRFQGIEHEALVSRLGPLGIDPLEGFHLFMIPNPIDYIRVWSDRGARRLLEGRPVEGRRNCNCSRSQMHFLDKYAAS